MNINFRVVLQIVPNIHRIVFLFETTQKAERKTACFQLHILFDERQCWILDHRLYSASRIIDRVCSNIIVARKIDVRQSIQLCVKACGVDRAKHVVAIILIGLHDVCDMLRIQTRLAASDRQSGIGVFG